MARKPTFYDQSRVPGLKEIGGVGLAAPRPGGWAAACSSFRAVALERPPYARSAISIAALSMSASAPRFDAVAANAVVGLG